MGAARKLQQEIDQVLKKVKDGIASFDEIHDKVRMRCTGFKKECASSSDAAKTQCNTLQPGACHSRYHHASCGCAGGPICLDGRQQTR
jgi:Not1 N-terminal domain, CCR4-Not complex component